MSQLAKKRIHNFNRYVIILLSLAGFVTDGIQVSDVLFLVATIFWIWLPEIERLDERLMQYWVKR